jgi:Mn-dependent DtxR family transcriptional regulator
MEASSEDQVVQLLAKEWDLSGPPGILDLSDLVAALPLAPSEVITAVKALFAAGLVDMNAFKTSVFLTPEGYARSEEMG